VVDNSGRVAVLGLPRRGATALGAVLAVAFVAYLVWFRDGPFLEADSLQYLDVARDLRDGGPSRLHERSPGYPLLLVATGSADGPTTALLVVQLLFHLVATWCVAVAAHALRAGAVGTALAVGLMLSPPLAEHAAAVMTETSTILALAVGFLAVVRWFERRTARWLVLAGAAVACAALCRPTYLLVGACGAAVLLVAGPGGWRGRARAAAAVAAGSVVLLGGLSLHNAVRFDYAGVTPTLGLHLTTRTAHFVEELPDEHAALRAVLVAGRDAGLVDSASHLGGLYYQAILADVEDVTGMEGAELDRHMARVHLELILQNPQEYLAGVGRAAADLTLPAFTDRSTHGSDAAHLLLLGLHYALALAFAGAVVLRVGERVVRRLAGDPADPDPVAGAWWVAVGLVAYTIAVSAAMETGGARLRVPTDPFAVVVIATAVPLVLALVRPPTRPRGLAVAEREPEVAAGAYASVG
jgi:hypothetical protein